VWLAIWIVPLVLVAWLTGPEGTLARLALFFSKLAVVTFGGAYAVLGYMAQDVVALHGWLTAPEMLDGLGLAETTPGPLILVTEFVGFLAAHRAYPEAALRMGLVGAVVALWATFAPCFLWIFAGAPYLDRIRRDARLQGTLSAITSAVLGVILSLSLWFATHVLFRTTHTIPVVGSRWLVPEPASLDLPVLVFTLASGVMLLGLRWPVLRVLLITALAAWAWQTLSTP
jgi:chromate transporter